MNARLTAPQLLKGAADRLAPQADKGLRAFMAAYRVHRGYPAEGPTNDDVLRLAEAYLDPRAAAPVPAGLDVELDRIAKSDVPAYVEAAALTLRDWLSQLPEDAPEVQA